MFFFFFEENSKSQKNDVSWVFTERVTFVSPIGAALKGRNLGYIKLHVLIPGDRFKVCACVCVCVFSGGVCTADASQWNSGRRGQ